MFRQKIFTPLLLSYKDQNRSMKEYTLNYSYTLK